MLARRVIRAIPPAEAVQYRMKAPGKLAACWVLFELATESTALPRPSLHIDEGVTTTLLTVARPYEDALHGFTCMSRSSSSPSLASTEYLCPESEDWVQYTDPTQLVCEPTHSYVDDGHRPTRARAFADQRVWAHRRRTILAL